MKGQSVLLQYALYVGVGISVIYLAVSGATPYLQNIEDTAAIQQKTRELGQLEQAIRQVAQMGTGSQMAFNMRIGRGELLIRNESIVYHLQSGSGIITAGSKRDIGNIVLSANARTTVRKTYYNGKECYLLQNQYVEACIRAYGGPGFMQASLNDTILYLRNRRVNTTVTPRLRVALDGDLGYSTGQVKTVPMATGEYLGTGELVVQVKPTDRPTYSVRIKLRSGSDFLQVSVE